METLHLQYILGILYGSNSNDNQSDIPQEAIGAAERIAELSQAGIFALISIILGFLVYWFYKREVKRFETTIRVCNKRNNELEKELKEWQTNAFEALEDHIQFLKDAKEGY